MKKYLLKVIYYEYGQDTPKHWQKLFSTYSEAVETARHLLKTEDVEWWDINEEEV